MFKDKQSGFTLIETVIYLALFAIMFSGAVAAAYSIIESSGRIRARAVMQEEGEFLLAKINWAVSTAGTASVSENGHLLADGLEFARSGDDLALNGLPLNTSTVKISDLYFDDISVAGSGQEGISYGFDLYSKTLNGAIITASASSTVYLRK